MRQHEYFMKTAIHLANLAGRRGEVPIGSIIVRQNDFKIIGYGYNFTENMNCSVEHAEVRAIRNASVNLKSWRLNSHGEVTLYTTIEPCMMCLGASKLSRINTVVYGAKNQKFGSTKTVDTANDDIEIIGGILEHECKLPLQIFFKNKRNDKNNKKKKKKKMII